jgi:hypothetical protein
MGGSSKSGGAGTTYNFYGTLAGALCAGPVDALVSIILNGQEMWPKGTPWIAGNTCNPGTPYVFDAQTWTCTTTHVATGANAPGSGLEGWTEYAFTRSGGATSNDFSLTDSTGVFWGVLRLYWGTSAQTVDPLLMSTGNTAGDQHPDYKGICYCLLIDFCLGQEIQSGPNVEIVVRRGANNQTVVVGSPASLTDGQVNIAAAAAEILTDPNCVGQPAAIVDAVSFQAAANYLDGGSVQPMTAASILIDGSETLRSVFDRLTAMVDGYFRFNPNTKKIEMGVYQHGVVPATYTTLTTDDLTAVPKFNTTSWQGTYSRATVRYDSRQLDYQQTSVSADDARAFAVLKTVRETNLDRPYIARPAQALSHGQETLRVVGHAQMTGELQVRREFGRGVRAGDYIFTDVFIEPGGAGAGQFFRVTSRKIPMTGPITLQVWADNTIATVPWLSPNQPKLVTQTAVPAVANFRVVEVPTVVAGERGAIVPLLQRPGNNIVGCQLFFDTNPAGTFTSLGNFPGFAAKATLQNNVATGDATITVNVDTTQPDADYFTNQYSALQQQNDTLIAVLVSLVTAGADAGEIAESGGNQIMEIMSVGAQTLVSAGQYTLSVLRGRQNTIAQAFPAASSEVWLIPRSMITPFVDATFETIRANRLLGLTPAYAQFRFCPYTFVASLPLSSATSEQFRFPLTSITAPSLTLSAPGSFTPAVYALTFPNRLNVAGVWSDPDQNLVEFEMTLQKSTDLVPRPVINQQFSPRGTYAFNTFASFDSTGTWTITLTARDSNNLSTSIQITATVTAPGTAAQTCAFPTFLDCNGNEIPMTVAYGGGIYTVTQSPKVPIPFGPITIKCSSPGSWCQFFTNGLVLQDGVLSNPAMPPAGLTYAADLQPFHGLFELGSPAVIQPGWTLQFCVLTTAPGYLNLGSISDPLSMVFPLIN